MEFTYFLGMNRFVSKLFYRTQTHLVGADDVVFLNVGYEEDPPMAVPLAKSDEPNRFHIQLYHRVAAQADLEGKRILDVGCGHGGGRRGFIGLRLYRERHFGLPFSTTARQGIAGGDQM